MPLSGASLFEPSKRPGQMARCNAYFPEAHIKLLETLFKASKSLGGLKMRQEQLLSSSDRLERGGWGPQNI